MGANDSDDSDSGPNRLLNYPEVQVNNSGIIQATGEWRFAVDVTVDVPGIYRVDFLKAIPNAPQHKAVKTGVRNNLITVRPEDAGKRTRYYVYVSSAEIAIGSTYGIQLTGESDGATGAPLAGLNSDSTSEMKLTFAQNNTPSLEGDFDKNGVVNGTDYLVWKNSYGKSVSAGTLAAAGDQGDGDRDGDVDGADFVPWQRFFGSTLTSSVVAAAVRTAGDYNSNGVIDSLDYDIWAATNGSNSDLRADGNANGVVDAADLVIWQELRGVTTSLSIFGDFDGSGIVDSTDYSIWAAGNDVRADADGDGILNDTDDYAIWNANFGRVRADLFPVIVRGATGLPLEVPDKAPTVIGVAIANGSGGNYGFSAVAGSGEQLRTVPLANANKVSVRFSEEVFLLNPALTLTNLDGASPGAATAFSYDVTTQSATWTFANPLADGRYLLRLSDSVFDLDREALNGEFSNPWFLTDKATSLL